MQQPIDETPYAEPPPPRMVIIQRLRRQLEDVMTVEDHEVLDPPDRRIVLRGRVRGDTGDAFETISERFAALGYTPMLRDRPGGGHELLAIQHTPKRKPTRILGNILLFMATVVSVLFIGAGYALEGEAIDIPQGFPGNLLGVLVLLYRGLPFAGTLLSILLAHELSHYFVGRRYGSPVSLPFFIPMPLGLIGTMGAVIVQRAPMRNRKVLFDIGIAGPLGGLIVAVPLLVLGLSLSEVQRPPIGVDVLQEGNSLLYLGLKYLVFGRILPGNGEDVWLHPVAFAAWAGLLVTMINLIPVGQLDGGHVTYALIGRRAWNLGYVAMIGMVVWGTWLTMSGNDGGWFWVTWSLFNLALNRRHPPPLNDSTQLSLPRRVFGVVMLGLFILLFMPVPLRFIPAQ